MESSEGGFMSRPYLGRALTRLERASEIVHRAAEVTGRDECADHHLGPIAEELAAKLDAALECMGPYIGLINELYAKGDAPPPGTLRAVS